MKILVAVKRVIDFNVKIRVKSDNSGVETDHIKMSLNPFDEIALEEALRLKEAGKATEILAVSIGTDACQEILRAALARGADRALLVKTEPETTFEPLNIAKILKAIALKEASNLILLGKQAIDDDCNQTGQMLAGLLGWSQGTFISKLVMLDDQQIEVTREVDAGLETIVLRLPTVLTADLRLNEPRYVTLPNVMKAKSKPLDSIPVSDFNLTLNVHQKILKVEAPVTTRSVKMVSTVKELVEKLRKEAKVIS